MTNEKRDSIRVEYKNGRKTVSFTGDHHITSEEDVRMIEGVARETGAAVTDPDRKIKGFYEKQLGELARTRRSIDQTREAMNSLARLGVDLGHRRYRHVSEESLECEGKTWLAKKKLSEYEGR